MKTCGLDPISFCFHARRGVAPAYVVNLRILLEDSWSDEIRDQIVREHWSVFRPYLPDDAPVEFYGPDSGEGPAWDMWPMNGRVGFYLRKGRWPDD